VNVELTRLWGPLRDEGGGPEHIVLRLVLGEDLVQGPIDP
jgi:hypothetical protein